MINYQNIVKSSYVDGPGERTVVYLQGCSVRCKGCQSLHLWPAMTADTKQATPVELARELMSVSPSGNITIQGGEPFDQVRSLVFLCMALRGLGAKSICVYSGFTWEYLTQEHAQRREVLKVLSMVDILVDGPFIPSLDHKNIVWRGSTNQRPINVPESLKGELVLLDWSRPVITLKRDGSVIAPIGQSHVVEPLGVVGNTRRCGQSRGKVMENG